MLQEEEEEEMNLEANSKDQATSFLLELLKACYSPGVQQSSRLNDLGNTLY